MLAIDPGFEPRTRDSFGRQPAMATLGVTMHSVEPGRRISVVDARATQHDAQGSEAKLIATMTATIMTLQGRAALKH